ncbi:SIMPL domain-containing protein [Paracoccus sp. p4-l81]|uniref:SIMPL domain-containing protein n=1 Tax=Paracoccus sp. p4-l81 TaxID=3342806 RepID=UPI0035BB31E2
MTRTQTKRRLSGLTPLAALLAALSAAPAMAQDQPTAAAPAPAHVIVTGTGRADLNPDMAQMMLGVTERGETAQAALTANSDRMARVLEALRAAGVEDRDLQTSGLTVGPQFDYSTENAPPTLVGYIAQNMVSVRLRDLDNLGAVLDGVMAAGATDFNGLTYGLQDMRPAEDAARRDAVAQARASATLYAAELGMTLGPVRTISEMPIAAVPQPVEMRAYGAAKGGADAALQPGEVSVTTQVTVEYQLLP